MKLTANKVEEKMNGLGVYPDSVHKYKGEFVARWGFYYRHGQTSEGKASQVELAFPEAVIVDHAEEWNPWPKDSYFEVRFTI